METEEYYLGIDPGKQGAFAFIDKQGNIKEIISTPLIGKEYNRQEIKNILLSKKIIKVGLENPNIIFGVSKSAVASLSNCVGLLEGIIYALTIPYILIRPKEWQKECWTHVPKQKNPKDTSTLAATNLFPNYDFKVTQKGTPSKKYNDGFIDAVLIAEYTRRKF